MDPEPKVPGFVHRVVDSTGKVLVQVVNECLRIRRLGELFVERLPEKHTGLPAPLRHVNTDVHMLTRKLNLCTFGVHGKPRFGCGTLLAGTTIYTLEPGLTF